MKNGYFTLNSFCNQKCLTCPTHNKDCHYEVDFVTLKNNIRDAVSNGLNHITFSGGEPLMYSHFSELVHWIKKFNIFVTILTNGTLLDSSVLKVLKPIQKKLKIVTAIHSDDEIEHDYITNLKGSFNLVIKNLSEANAQGFSLTLKIILNSKTINKLKQISTFLTYNFRNPFCIDITSMDCVGLKDENKFLTVNGDEIFKSLDDYAIWFMNLNFRKFNIAFSEFPICLMSQNSIKFVQFKPFKRQFVFLPHNSNNLIYNSLYDCAPCLDQCKECLFYDLCPGIWSSNKEYFENFCVSLKGKKYE